MYCPFMTTSVERPRTSWIPDDSTFGARLALVRQHMGWGNVLKAAEECKVPVESWRRWERDGRRPHDIQEQAEKISERTGCDFDWLLRGRRTGQAGVQPNERLAAIEKTAGRRNPKRRPEEPAKRREPAPNRPVSTVPPSQRRPCPVRPGERRMAA